MMENLVRPSFEMAVDAEAHGAHFEECSSEPDRFTVARSGFIAGV
jgi:hypothetical protein